VANNKSAEKRNRQKERRRLRNRNVLGSMRSAIKKARAAVEEKSAEAGAVVRNAMSAIDKAVSKGAIPRNTGSRYISRLTRSASSSSKSA
jgi:small subunit ribosomal protein S20